MRIVVMSDSHGNAAAIDQVLQKEPTATAVIHLGDGAREAQAAAARYQTIEWHIVRGNCDMCSDVPTKKMITVGGKRLYLTHGHAERVKSGLLTLTFTAREQEVHAALYGHTHCPATQYDGGILLLNPGSVGADGRYAVLTVEKGELISTMCCL